MAIVNLINKLGLESNQVAGLMSAANTLIPVFNLRNNVTLNTLVAVNDMVKILDWYKVSQDRVIKPIGNVVGSWSSNKVLRVSGNHLLLTGTLAVPVYSIIRYSTVINDLLASAIACIAKQDLQKSNVYMKSFYMLRSMYYQRNVEYSQIRSLKLYPKNYL